MIIEGKGIDLIYDVQKEYPTHALRDISLKVEEGEILGIMGPSGSGKSSLLYVLSGLRNPTAGKVYHDDLDIGLLSAEKRALERKRNFGFIFQSHFLIDYLPVLENTLAAFEYAGEAETGHAKELLERLHIGHLAGRLPCELSAGQKQRVAAVRALVSRPAVIFADEPTASLDHTCAREVMEAVMQNKGKASILIVTHDRSILKGVDRVVEIWDGRLLR